MDKVLDEKKINLKKILSEYAKEDVCLAFSGGVDSAVLLYMCCEAAKVTGKKVYAVTLDTVLHPKSDLEAAKAVVEKTSGIHQVIKVDELSLPEIKNNPVNRCYLCKKKLFTEMIKFGQEEGCNIYIEGTNADDLKAYRPGIKAIQELGIKSPFVQAEINKSEVRALAREYKIEVAERPSAPCLATRLPYGTLIDVDLLKEIALCEEKLHEEGFKNVRIRVHKNIVRIELDLELLIKFIDKKEMLVPYIKNTTGCDYVTVDLEGFRSGSMDIHVNKASIY